MWQDETSPTAEDLRDDLPEDFFSNMRKELYGLHKQEWKSAFKHFLDDDFAEANEAVLCEVAGERGKKADS